MERTARGGEEWLRNRYDAKINAKPVFNFAHWSFGDLEGSQRI
jgi:hypothetical protein